MIRILEILLDELKTYEMTIYNQEDIIVALECAIDILRKGRENERDNN